MNDFIFYFFTMCIILNNSWTKFYVVFIFFYKRLCNEVLFREILIPLRLAIVNIWSFTVFHGRMKVDCRLRKYEFWLHLPLEISWVVENIRDSANSSKILFLGILTKRLSIILYQATAISISKFLLHSIQIYLL